MSRERESMSGREVRDPAISLQIGRANEACEGALRKFLWLVSAIVIGQAVYAALLASWQEGHYSSIATAWANAGLLLGIMLLVWCIHCWRNRD
jgi:hypothetical protein